MTNPLYRVRASGMGGSGYARPPVAGEPSKMVTNADGRKILAALGDDEKPIIVPGVTTVIKAFGDPPALVQWKIDQVAAYAVANIDSLYNRTMEQGWGFLRWYPKRNPDIADPLRNAHDGVLSDLAQLGTNVHEWTQADVDGGMYPPIDSDQMAQMVDAWKLWRFSNSVEGVMTEVTVYGDGYAGTFDGLWRINGRLSLLDEKTSRAIGESHKMQLAALRNANTYYVRSGQEFIAATMPKPEEYGFIQLRPDDDEHAQRRNRFVEYHTIEEWELDLHLEKFKSALKVLQIDRQLRYMEKSAIVSESQNEEKDQ